MESVRDGRIHKSQRSAIGTKDEEARKRDAIARLVASEASQASIEPPTGVYVCGCVCGMRTRMRMRETRVCAERPFAGVTVHVNRSPVMILWAACLASRLGHEWPACLSLGSAVAAMNARSKGCRSAGGDLCATCRIALVFNTLACHLIEWFQAWDLRRRRA